MNMHRISNILKFEYLLALELGICTLNDMEEHRRL